MPWRQPRSPVPSRAVAWKRPSRRGVLLAAGLLAGAGRAAAAAKVPQRQADYRDRPNGPARCERCVQFLPPASCKLVDGAISPNGWCSFFGPRPP